MSTMTSVRVKVVLVLFIFSANAEDVAWTETHVQLSMHHPFKSDTFPNYPQFLDNLPDIFSNIKNTAVNDILLKSPEVTEKASYFAAYLCQDGYELKGYGSGLGVCSRFRTKIEDYFEMGDKKCVRNICHLEFEEDGVESATMKPDHSTMAMEDASKAQNVTVTYDCVTDEHLCNIAICEEYGMQGLTNNGSFGCATSRCPNDVTCKDCLPGKTCLSHQYGCGVIELTIGDNSSDSHQGLLCCTDGSLSVMVVQAEPPNWVGTFPANKIEEKVKETFDFSRRKTLASVHVKEGGGELTFAVCPPRYYVQGFNGDQLLCSQNARDVEITYDGNANGECEQRLDFPADGGQIPCLARPSPMFKICETSFVSQVTSAKQQAPCTNSALKNNAFNDRGIGCEFSKDAHSCTNHTTTCGLIVDKAANKAVNGLICCGREKKTGVTDLEELMNRNKHEFLFFYKMIQTERRTLTVAEITNEASMLYNKKIQEYMEPQQALDKCISPMYKQKMWVHERYPGGPRFPETVIFCPNNTYVRGVHSSEQVGDHFRILCSEEEPYIDSTEVKIANTELCLFIYNLNDYQYACGGNSFGETFQFCANGTFFCRVNGVNGKFCHKDPCGPNNAVCGITNTAYNHPIFIVCCEPHKTPVRRLPPPLDEMGNVNPAAVNYFMDRFTKDYRVEHNGAQGTQAQVLTYYREKHLLPRLYTFITVNDYMSVKMNAGMERREKPFPVIGSFDYVSGLKYFLIDEEYYTYGIAQERLRAALCPPGSYVRGRALGGILCSERVPKIGKRFMNILGSNETCIINTPPNPEYDIYGCVHGLDLVVICSRGFYGWNSPLDRGIATKCTNGFQCSEGPGNENAKICGILMPQEKYESSKFEKVICCKPK